MLQTNRSIDRSIDLNYILSADHSVEWQKILVRLLQIRTYNLIDFDSRKSQDEQFRTLEKKTVIFNLKTNHV